MSYELAGLIGSSRHGQRVDHTKRRVEVPHVPARQRRPGCGEAPIRVRFASSGGR